MFEGIAANALQLDLILYSFGFLVSHSIEKGEVTDLGVGEGTGGRDGEGDGVEPLFPCCDGEGVRRFAVGLKEQGLCEWDRVEKGDEHGEGEAETEFGLGGGESPRVSEMELNLSVDEPSEILFCKGDLEQG